MSAKCDATSKFLPLLKMNQLMKTPEEFKAFIEQHFNNAEEVYNGLMGNVLQDLPQTPVMEVEQEDLRFGRVITDDDTSINYLYNGEASKKQKMLKNFKTKLIESSIYNLKTKQFIDASAIINETSALNNNILQYKIELLNNIVRYINDSELLIDFNEHDENTLTQKAVDIISAFETKVTGENVDQDINFDSAFDSYVIYSKFDSLLKQVPFIEVKKEYQKLQSFIIDKYNYKGPSVKHRTNVMNSSEMSMEDGMGDMAKILLDYFPEVNEGTFDIDGSSIGINGFNEIMAKVVTAVYSNPYLKSLRPELEKGVNINWNKVLSKYLVAVTSNNVNKRNETSIYRNKIRGLMKYVFAPQMNKDIREMFNHLAFKVNKANYLLIAKDKDTAKMSTIDLTENQLSIQRNQLMDAMAASILQFRANPQVYADLKTKFGIVVSKNNIIINEVSGNIPNSATISATFSNKWEFKINGQISDKLLFQLSNAFLSRVLPNNLGEIIPQLNEKVKTTNEAVLPLIATILKACEPGNNNFTFEENKLPKLGAYYSTIVPLANALSIIEGSDVVTVVKNPEGNNLPSFQMTTLATSIPKLINHISKQKRNNRGNIFDYNPLKESVNDGFLGNPARITGVNLRGINKSITALSTGELLMAEILFNFYESYEKKFIHIQPTTYSDKSTIYVPRYNIDVDIKKVNILNELKSFFEKGGNLSKIWDLSLKSRGDQLKILYNNILKDYNDAFEMEFKSFSEVNDFIHNKRLNPAVIQQTFLKKGIKFLENTHAYTDPVSKITRLNESIESDYNTFTSKTLFNTRMEIERRNFLKDLIDSGFSIPTTVNKHTTWVENRQVILAKFKKNGSEKTIEEAINDHSTKLELHPILEAYFAVDNLLSWNYNMMVVGGVYAHKNSNQESNIGTDEYNVKSESSRWLAFLKRQAVQGSTVHLYAQGLKNGVLPFVKAAVILDNPAMAWNPMGDKKKTDSMDGGGFTSTIASRMANNSLIDARAGKNKKTTFHNIDPLYATAGYLKWEEFALTNEHRISSLNSPIPAENAIKKMLGHQKFNIKIDLNTPLKAYGKDLYFRDQMTGNYYKIVDINTGFNSDQQWIATRNIIQVDRHGNEIGIVFQDEDIVIDSVYSIDQVYGGAWSMEMNGDRLDYGEANDDLTEQIVYEYDLRDKIIFWLVNKSAIKVGAGNVNPTDRFSNEDPFDTIDFSTEFGGLQLDQDHDLDHSVVTEMTQMISSLEQMGFTHDLVTSIYNDIAQVIKESNKVLNAAIAENDKDKVYDILARSMIKAFGTNDKETIGLAQTFVALAENSLRNNNLEYVIPFSAATINGSFVSTVSSNLTKSGIRRKYAGVASTQVPGHDMIQYYQIGDSSMNYDEFLTHCIELGIRHDRKRNPATIAVEDIQIQGQLNPFLKEITDLKLADFEDTIVTINPVTKTISTTKIDTLDKYYEFRNAQYNPLTKYYIFTSRPKSLKGMNIKFEVNGRQFSLYDLDSVQAAYIVNKYDNFNKLSDLEFAIVTKVWGVQLENRNTPIDRKGLIKLFNTQTQETLLKLSKGESIPDQIAFENTLVAFDGLINVENIKVEAAQIIMGKRFAQELGLRKGDTINQIRKEKEMFFYKRLMNEYQPNNANKSTYDVVLYTNDGEQIYVKYADESFDSSLYNIVDNPEFKIIEGRVFHNGIEICNADEKQFKKYIDPDGNSYHLVIIGNMNRINELRNSGIISSYKLNYTEDNKNYLFNFQFEKRLQATNKLINLETLNGPVSIQSPDQVTWAELNHNENVKFSNRLKRISINKYHGFEKSLQMIGTRIPTQSMQSFSPVEIIMFTDSDINEVYISKHNMFLMGSDFDADKVYLIGYGLTKNGEFLSTSALSNKYPADVILNLPLPNGKHYTSAIAPEGEHLITIHDLEAYINGDLSVFHEIYNEDVTILQFQLGTDEELIYDFMEDLNRHSATKYDSKTMEEGIKNRIVAKMWNVVTNPSNFINLHNPVDAPLDILHEIADTSEIGQIEKTRRADNPASKFSMQYQAGIGKKGVGISAVSMKSYFMLSNFYNSQYDKIKDLLRYEQHQEIVNLLEDLVFVNPYDKGLGILANIKLDELEQLTLLPGNSMIYATTTKFAAYKKEDQFNLRQFIVDLRSRANVDDASLMLSAMVTAAVDNMKELILVKINATPEFSDIYGYLIQVGIPLEEIAKIMMSPSFNYVAKLASRNIFKPETDQFTLDTAISFYLGRGLLPFIDGEVLWKTINIFSETNISLKQILQGQLNDDKFLGKYSEWLQQQVGNFEQEYDEYEEDESHYEDDYYEESDLEQQESNFKRNWTKNPITKSEYYNLMIFCNYVLDRNQNVNKLGKQEVEQIVDIIPHTKEMKMIGRMGAMNQGLPSGKYDIYNYIKSIEIFINKRIEKYNKARSTNIAKVSIFNNFNGDIYSLIKSSHNIIDVIKTVPHFAEMFNMLDVQNFMLQNFSVRNKLESFFANLITGDTDKLNDREYNEVVKYTGDILIHNWLKHMNLSIGLPVGQKYYKGNQKLDINNTEGYFIDLSTPNGQASFKKLMDDYIILSLKEKYSDNEFLLNLTLGMKKTIFNPITFYKPIVNMRQIDSSQNNQFIYEQMLRGLNKLNKKTEMGWNIVDLFFIYNLLVHKDAISQNSYTRVFQDMINTYPNLLVTKYNEFIGDLDKGADADLSYDLNDLRFRLTLASRNNAHKFDSSFNGTNVYVKNEYLDLKQYNFSDYSLNMPYMNMQNAEKVTVLKVRDKQPRRYYDKIFNKAEIITQIVNKLGGKVQLHRIDDFAINDPTRNAKAYIENGEVHIILENADLSSPLHEFTHVIMAGLKINNPELFYSLLTKIKTHPKYNQLYEEIRSNPTYENKHGSDLEEEVFATILGDYYDNKLYPWTEQDDFKKIEEITPEVIDNMLGIKNEELKVHDLMQMNIEEILDNFQSLLVNWDYNNVAQVRLNQELSTLKNNLFRDGILEEKCD